MSRHTILTSQPRASRLLHRAATTARSPGRHRHRMFSPWVVRPCISAARVPMVPKVAGSTPVAASAILSLSRHTSSPCSRRASDPHPTSLSSPTRVPGFRSMTSRRKAHPARGRGRSSAAPVSERRLGPASLPSPTKAAPSRACHRLAGPRSFCQRSTRHRPRSTTKST
jgi:hypothetical protein